MLTSYPYPHFLTLAPKATIESLTFVPDKQSAQRTIGRPAKACLTCRKRKVKCDLRVPSCGNCDQHGWLCDGTKKTSTYKFINENAKTARRADSEQVGQRVLETKSRSSKGADDVVPVSPTTLAVTKTHDKPRMSPLEQEGRNDGDDVRMQHPWRLIMEIGVDVDEVAIAYFFTAHTYGWVGQPVNVTDGNGSLIASIRALGLAGLSRFDVGNKIRIRTQSQYLEAVTLTNSALQSNEYIRRDSTLLSVYILSIFETTVGMRKSNHRWREHIKGAAGLLYMRGSEQFKTSTGGRLFCQVAVSLSISCIQERIPLPDHFRLVMYEARQSLQEHDTLWRLCELGFRFVDLYAGLSPGNSPGSQNSAEKTLHEAFDIDSAVLAFYDGLPISWSYERIETDDAAAITGYYHIYRTSLIASALNALRCMRVLLSDIMLKAFESCPTAVKLQILPCQISRIRESSQSVKVLLLDILASVPQHLSQPLDKIDQTGWSLNTTALLGPADKVWENFRSLDISPWQNLPTPSIDLPKVRMAGGFLPQWSLYVAGILLGDESDDKVLRQWLINVLKRLGNDVGMNHAIELASELEISWTASSY